MNAPGIDQAISDIEQDFALLPDWEERIAYLIDLGRALAPLHDSERVEANRVRGCASQVWLVRDADPAPNTGAGALHFRGDSDAHLVKGEIALLLRIFSERTPAEILSVDPHAVFARLGLKDALTAQRSNGLFAMMNRIQADARAATASGT